MVGSATPTTVVSSRIMHRLPVMASSVSHFLGAPCSDACITPASYEGGLSGLHPAPWGAAARH